ncbi:hypothetical protein BDA99DRAFT_539131 [Phascolomyces articulosus]|uniref:Uncharacterized protein n=1 Tax=Phascolomyces articulosus TaxID=60185 RepID=A0AAD5PCP6_9FUNG|nr:hypothetical protein BDA99DRAFT_539131 [Phascolomyces articulosus]
MYHLMQLPKKKHLLESCGKSIIEYKYCYLERFFVPYTSRYSCTTYEMKFDICCYQCSGNYDKYNSKQLLQDYWTIQFDDLTPINPVIEIGFRLIWITKKDVIGGSLRERNENRLDDFFTILIIDVEVEPIMKMKINNKYLECIVAYLMSPENIYTKSIADDLHHGKNEH